MDSPPQFSHGRLVANTSTNRLWEKSCWSLTTERPVVALKEPFTQDLLKEYHFYWFYSYWAGFWRHISMRYLVRDLKASMKDEVFSPWKDLCINTLIQRVFVGYEQDRPGIAEICSLEADPIARDGKSPLRDFKASMKDEVSSPCKDSTSGEQLFMREWCHERPWQRCHQRFAHCGYSLMAMFWMCTNCISVGLYTVRNVYINTKKLKK